MMAIPVFLLLLSGFMACFLQSMGPKIKEGQKATGICLLIKNKISHFPVDIGLTLVVVFFVP